jgi:hypothetical protein
MRHCSTRHNLFMNNYGRISILTMTRHPVIGRHGQARATPCEPAPVKAFRRAIVEHRVGFSTIAVDNSVHILYIRALSGPPAGEIVAMPNLTPLFPGYFSRVWRCLPGRLQSRLTVPTGPLFDARIGRDVLDKLALACNLSNDPNRFYNGCGG